MNGFSDFDTTCMLRAIALARRGEGTVEPNPMVGCVIAHDGQIVAEGWHEKFGGPHAEIRALQSSSQSLRGATAYVTLEPCCHFGKTPPCTNALLAAGIKRVVAAQRDPFPRVAGGGIAQLQAAGVQVEVGCCSAEAQSLNAPYLALVSRQRPWVIAKWAMSLDGKIATHTQHSRWISNATSRLRTHQLRARVDAIVVGLRTAIIDDPLLTARLPNAAAPVRIATRVVLDSQAQLPLSSQLVRTAREVPVLLFTSPQAPLDRIAALQAAGCEVVAISGTSRTEQHFAWLQELGRRQMTNVLVEGGGQVLGTLFDAALIDEVQAFIAPKLIGGAGAPSPLAGLGLASVNEQPLFIETKWECLDGDGFFQGRVKR